MSAKLPPGSQVRLKTAADRIGIVTGKYQERAGRVRYEVNFKDGDEYIPFSLLEEVKEKEDVYDLIKEGRYGGVKNLRMAMTHMRLSGRLADVIYSMEASNTEFYAYQFKPVINFLNSPSNGLLIADEVGLGKTIEAGLIWTEMRARFDANRLLIIAPAVLREKWQAELSNRFGVKADICNAGELLEKLKRQKTGGQGFAAICSLQGLRSSSGWEELGSSDLASQSNNTQLAHYFNEHGGVETLFDCVVIDEAHYLRNPSTSSHKLGKMLRTVSENIILLSATPVQLRQLDLFHLLNLIDPENFRYEFAFEQIMKANAPILALSGALRQGALTEEKYLELLEACLKNSRFKGNKQLNYLFENAASTEDLSRPVLREALATKIDRVNSLAQVVSRTRKRFVLENKVIRTPKAIQIDLSVKEREFYDHVTEVVREYCSKKDLVDGFILTIPQRQMSSSIPAAFRAWTQSIKQYDEELQLYEQGCTTKKSSITIGPLVQSLADEVREFASYRELYEEDSKYKSLILHLREYWKINPGKKVVLFSYYKETLRYLKERLDEDGVLNQILYGGMSEKKQSAIDRFREDAETLILLASEVASEGVDLQFSSFLVNYDLPWNPMRVEQRIGRIDRIGQKEDRILIQNYFYSDTLDDRIYRRLYERLGIFKSALGDMEAVLGEKVNELTRDLLSHKMTSEEEEQRIDATESAIQHNKQTQIELEKEAMHFAANGDYVLNQVHAARQMKRYVQDNQLWAYVHEFLCEYYPGCSFLEVEGDYISVQIDLSIDARLDLKNFIERHVPDRRSLLAGNTRGKKILCVFTSHVDLSSHEYEVINQQHPLVRFVTWSLGEKAYYPLVGVSVKQEVVPELGVGHYLFVIKRWSTNGAKVAEQLVFRAVRVDASTSSVNDIDAERLISAAVESGVDVAMDTASFEAECVLDLYHDLESSLDDDFIEYALQKKMENEDRIEMMVKVINEKTESEKSNINSVVESLNARGKTRPINAFLGKLKKVENHREIKLAQYQKMKDIASTPHQVMAGMVVVK